MLIAEPVIADVYQLDLWAGRQQLWSDSFKPSSHGEQAGEGGAAGAPAAGLEGRGAGSISGRGSKQPPACSQT